MPLIYESDIIQRGTLAIVRRGATVKSLLQETSDTAKDGKQKKVSTLFLSHSFLDDILLVGLQDYFQSLQYRVIINWIDDTSEEKCSITKRMATRLRVKMSTCSCLLYVITQSSGSTKWMPWELGYAEGLLGRCAILPLSPGPEESKMYFGPEYLGLYPYLMRTPIHGQETLFVHTSPESFVLLDSWLQGHDPILH